MPTITINTSGGDPAGSLQVVLSTPTVQTSTMTLKEIQARIAAYPAQIQALQDAQAADQALLDSILGVFSAAGVSDFTSPLDPTTTKAINDQNDIANQAILQAQIDQANTKLTVLTTPAEQLPPQ